MLPVVREVGESRLEVYVTGQSRISRNTGSKHDSALGAKMTVRLKKNPPFKREKERKYLLSEEKSKSR